MIAAYLITMYILGFFVFSIMYGIGKAGGGSTRKEVIMGTIIFILLLLGSPITLPLLVIGVIAINFFPRSLRKK